MNWVAQLAVFANAVLLIGVAPLEMFFYGRAGARRFLHVDTKNVEDVRLWAFLIGFRNVLGAVGAIIGLVILHTGDETVGRTVVLVACWYMLLASLAMAVADLLGHWRPRGGSVMGTVASSVLPLVAILAATL
jgi:putative membrane protein